MPPTTATEIQARIEAEITAGTRQPGEQLASVRALATSLGVSPTTVAAAYRRLRERGFVVSKGRNGTRVAPQPNVVPSGQVSVPAHTIDALSGNPDPLFLPSLGAALAAAAAAPAAQYGGTLLDDDLREISRSQFGRDGVMVDHLAVTNGAMDGIERVIAAQDLRQGDRIGVEDPGHVPVHQLVRSAGLDAVPIPVDDEGITVEGLAMALRFGLRALVVTPRAQNPTGAAFTAARAEAIDKLVRQYPDLVVIQDDHAGPISGVDYVGLGTGDRWAVVRSLGKSLGPDLRVALVAGDQQTIDRVNRSVANGPGWVSHLLQRAAAQLLGDTQAIELVAQAAASYQHKRSYFIDALARHDVSATARSGINVWVPVADEQVAVEAARRAGFAIRAAATYRIETPPAVRVTLSLLSERDLDELAAALGHGPTPHSPAM